MLKKGLVAGGGLALLLGLFLGRDVFSYVKTSFGWVKDSVKDSVPVQFELERARKMIQDLDPEISQHKRQDRSRGTRPAEAGRASHGRAGRS